MKLFILLALAITACAHSNTPAQLNKTQIQTHEPLVPTQRTLVWADEFEQTSKQNNEPINAKNWTHQTGGHGWGNNEEQYYTARKKNSRVENGFLIIESHKEDFENKHYTSARLLSTHKWRYGRFEMRAKLPQGRGSWAAFWMLSESLYDGTKLWPDCGEIDIMEHVGFNPGVIESSVHTKAYNWMNKGNKTDKVNITEPFSQFHLYAVEWYPDRIEFYVDELFIYKFDKEPNADFNKWPFDQEARIIINNAVGGIWGGKEGIDDTSFPQKMLIDYIRVYQ